MMNAGRFNFLSFDFALMRFAQDDAENLIP